MQDQILEEAERLWSLGFAVLWLKPKSKAPCKAGWTTGPRESWENLKKSYIKGMNVGVRLGTPSKINGKYLACLDVDVKAPGFKEKAENYLGTFLNGHRGTIPEVASGRGGGSKHLYCLTEKPFKMKTLLKDKEGEICFYSDGRQMVLPFAVHPDSGQTYKWTRAIKEKGDLPLIDTRNLTEVRNLERGEMAMTEPSYTKFTPCEYDLLLLTPEMASIIIDADVENRSDHAFPIVKEMVKLGYTDQEIISAFMDPENAISQMIKDHTKSSDFQKGSTWFYQYTVLPAKRSLESEFLEFEIEGETLPPLEGAAIDEQLRELGIGTSDWRQRLDRTRGQNGAPGRVKPTLKNIVLILENSTLPMTFRRDVFSMRETYGNNTPWGCKKDALLGDEDTPKIKLWLSQHFGIEPATQDIQFAVVLLCEKNSYDSVIDMLEALPEWDETPRLSTWLAKNFEAQGDAEYLDQVFTKWMSAFVLRAYEPGAKFDWLPIFEGKQGVGKSSFGRILVGEKYFLDWLPDLGDKDSALALQGIWGVEFGELASIRKWDLASTKQYITRTVDKIRPPFGRRSIELARRSVFFGTTNEETYFVDDENRRFKPVKVGQLNFKALRQDRDQLFAEALYLYRTGMTIEDLELTGRAKVYEAEIHAEKMIEDDSDIMAEELKIFLDSQPPDKEFEMRELFGEWHSTQPLAKWRRNKFHEWMASKALRKLGYQKRKSNSKRLWVKQGHGQLRATPSGGGPG